MLANSTTFLFIRGEGFSSDDAKSNANVRLTCSNGVDRRPPAGGSASLRPQPPLFERLTATTFKDVRTVHVSCSKRTT